jgi:hypothetical protein
VFAVSTLDASTLDFAGPMRVGAMTSAATTDAVNVCFTVAVPFPSVHSGRYRLRRPWGKCEAAADRGISVGFTQLRASWWLTPRIGSAKVADEADGYRQAVRVSALREPVATTWAIVFVSSVVIRQPERAGFPAPPDGGGHEFSRYRRVSCHNISIYAGALRRGNESHTSWGTS